MNRKKLLILFLLFLAVVSSSLYFFYLRGSRKTASGPETPVTHYSAFSQKDFYDLAFVKAPTLPKNFESGMAVAAITNHHLLAPHFVAQAVSAIATDQPITIVLLSPNHLAVGRGLIIGSVAVWETPYGRILPDLDLLEKIKSEAGVVIEEEPFETEHGIFNITGFIKRVAPNSRLLPFIIKERISEDEAKKFGQVLSQLLPASSVVLASMDFFHGPSLQQAKAEDANSLRILKNRDSDAVKTMSVDSRAVIRILFEFLKNKKISNFTLLEHSNSAAFVPAAKLPEITSYITGYFY